jgi:hypothetical protein
MSSLGSTTEKAKVEWMISRNRSAWRRRTRNRRAARYAVPLAVPVALGLVVGAVIAFSGGSHAASIQESALGVTASGSPSASPSVAPSGNGAASPTATATTPAATTAAANVNCTLIVPAHPLSAQGLATPYQLTGTGGMSPAQSGCQMSNAANLGAFVQATILNPATGQVAVYNPLVITQGTTPAVTPTPPALPAGAVVTIDFGFNGTGLTLAGATGNALRDGSCVNGQPGSIFGQVAFCNGVGFTRAAFQAERQGRLVVPSAGTSAKIIPSGGALGTGNACPVTRNFDMVDQDQSDNVTTLYLLNPATGQTAQDTTANQGKIPGAAVLANGSDNILLDGFLDPLFGCTPFNAPDLANNGTPTSSQALDELLAAKNQPAIAALVPENDEMVLNNGAASVGKTDLYRAQLGQAPVDNATNTSDSPAKYCQNLVNIQTPFLAANQALLATGPSPVPAVGTNLFSFMANRLSMSFVNLGCHAFGLTNPVTVTLNGAGAATTATFNTTLQTATGGGTGAAPAPAPGPGPRGGRHHHRWMDPSGM